MAVPPVQPNIDIKPIDAGLASAKVQSPGSEPEGKTYYESGPFIAVNVLSIFLSLPTVNNPPMLLQGKKATDFAAQLNEGHRTQYGMQLGLPDGDLFDAYQMLVCFVLSNFCWVPCSWAQALAIMSDTWLGLAMTIIPCEFLVPKTPGYLVGGTAMTGVLFFIGQIKLLFCVWRLLLTVANVYEYLYLLAAWAVFCVIIHAKFLYMHHYVAQLPGAQFVLDISVQMAVFRSSPTLCPEGKWESGATHPKGFDFARDGPKLDPATLEALKLPAAPTHEDIEKFYLKFLEETPCSKDVCIASCILVLAIGLVSWAATSAASSASGTASK